MNHREHRVSRRSLAAGSVVILVVLVVIAYLAWRSTSGQMPELSSADLGQLEERVADNPDDWRVQYWYGRRAAESGDVERGETALRYALGGNPDYMPAAAQLGIVLLARGKVDEAFQVLRMVVGRDPSETEGHLALAQLYRSQASYHKAMELLQGVLKRDPNNALANYELAACHVGLQQFEAAEGGLREAVRQDPDNPTYLTALSRVRRQRGDPAEAERLAREASLLSPQDYVPKLELARAVAMQEPLADRRQAALKLLAEAARLSPENPGIHFEMGRLLHLTGRPIDAASEFERVVRDVPHYTEAYYLLARSYDQAGRKADSRRIDAVFRRKREYDRKVQELSARLGAEPESASIRFQLADLHLAEGDLPRAMTQYRAGLQREPENAEAKRKLAELVRKRVEAGGQ